MTSPPNAIDVQNVDLGYTGSEVANDLSLSIKSGSTFALVGGNGVGKTTLIKSIISLRDQTAGEIKIFGLEKSSKEARKSFGYLPERFDPPPFLSGVEFIKFTLRLYSASLNKVDMLGMADVVDLRHSALDKKIKTYSKGMRQKLGIMAILLSGVKLLILDEPMSGLDPMARVAVKDLIIKAKGQGKTIFLSSHILADIDEICDEMAVLHKQTFMFVGKPADLKTQLKEDSLERAYLKCIQGE